MSPSRRPSLIDLADGDEDTFERVLKVNAHQEALLAYYYLNHSDKVEFERCEVYNVNETQSPMSTSPTTSFPPSRVYEVEAWAKCLPMKLHGDTVPIKQASELTWD